MNRHALALLAILATAPVALAQGALDAETKKSVEAYFASGSSEVANALVKSAPARPLADLLLEELRRDPAAHPRHAAACALLAKLVETNDLGLPVDDLLAVADHADPRCQKAGVAAARAALKPRPKVAAELEKRIDGLFADIETKAREQKIDELVATFAKLEPVLRDYRSLGAKAVRAKLDAWDKRLDEFKEIRLAMKLQMDIAEGNQILQTMSKALRAERAEIVREQFEKMGQLVDEMKKDEREEFHRNADALSTRAAALREEAEKLERISKWRPRMKVTAIVIDPRPDGKNRAVVHVGDKCAIYELGDPIQDEKGDEIPGLRVVKIEAGVVRFRFEDVEFTLELHEPK